MRLDRDKVPEDIYLLNTEANRQIVTKIQNGEFSLSGLQADGKAYVEVEEQPDIFTLYEQNVGMLTDTDLLPRQISFLPWLEALSIYCLIEKFCQLIDLFEFTESLIFWFVLQNKLKFEYIL